MDNTGLSKSNNSEKNKMKVMDSGGFQGNVSNKTFASVESHKV